MTNIFKKYREIRRRMWAMEQALSVLNPVEWNFKEAPEIYDWVNAPEKNIFRKYKDRKLRKWAIKQTLAIPLRYTARAKITQEIYDWAKTGITPKQPR